MRWHIITSSTVSQWVRVNRPLDSKSFISPPYKIISASRNSTEISVKEFSPKNVFDTLKESLAKRSSCVESSN